LDALKKSSGYAFLLEKSTDDCCLTNWVLFKIFEEDGKFAVELEGTLAVVGGAVRVPMLLLTFVKRVGLNVCWALDVTILNILKYKQDSIRIQII